MTRGEMEIEEEMETGEGYVDYRFRPALRGRHGGMCAAFFILVVEVLENLAFVANASNLVLYLSKYMNLSPSKSANNVTNFMATAFLLALLGGFLSDAFITSYYIFLISAGIEFLGLITLTFQACSPYLKPAPCDTSNATLCEEVHGLKAAMLFIGLYLVAIGVGGIKGSLPAFGAEQFDQNTQNGRKQTSTFFNYFVFSLSCGALIAVTLVLWIEDNLGWQWGFGISTLMVLFSIVVFIGGSRFYRSKVPQGSPLTTIFKVLLAASLKSQQTNPMANSNSPKSPCPLIDEHARAHVKDHDPNQPNLSTSLKWLNRAVENKSFDCSVQQVEDAKTVVRILPILGCTVILNCCLAQLSTFSVHQAATMNTNLGSFKVPPASLPVFPILFNMILVPLYDHLIIPFVRKRTKYETGISHLQRVGLGLCFSIIAMAVAALVETKRKTVAKHRHNHDATEPLPITVFWVAFQYLFLGSADLFVLAGLMEFSFTEAPIKMRSLVTSFSCVSLAMGYYLSSVIVAVVNGVTGVLSDHRPWLSGKNLNYYRLERFYWLLCVLSFLNFLHFLFWANRYEYKSARGNT